MPRQQNFSVENNFSKGLLTEHTALNFPENACTETFNCVFDNLGNVGRRLGFEYEPNSGSKLINRGGNPAISTFIWNNAGGDGGSTIYVLQVGKQLHFNYISAGPNISAHPLPTIIDLELFKAPNVATTSLIATECQYAEGNGYLFVFNDFMRPIFCSFNPGIQTISATVIDIKIRDFTGVEEVPPLGDSERPTTLSNTHRYNIANQGWGDLSYSVPVVATWNVDPVTGNVKPGTINIGVETGDGTLPIKVGDRVKFRAYVPPFNPPAIIYADNSVTGTVTSFESDGTLLFTSTATAGTDGWPFNTWLLSPDPDILGTWLAATGIYPSNADVWWQFKDSAGVFNPAVTYSSNLITSGPAPKGHFILDAFEQNRAAVSGVPLGSVICNTRPRTGAWYAGRLWMAGADGGPQFTENIYFSQIIETNSQFAKMYQVNDPTAEETFDLLPSDGGVIKIAGCGAIRKLFAIQSGILVFAANGIWFIAGNQGIGFTANDYSVSKISEVRIASPSSFVSVLGLPSWWNDEGIYMIQVAERGGLNAISITDSTIASFYKEISFGGKRFARGAYNPLTQTVQWCYNTSASGYDFTRILNYNISTQTFYPWAIEAGLPKICGINFVYIDPPMFKYLTSVFTGGDFFTLSEERNESYLDWVLASTPIDYKSYFITGYKLHGQAQRKFQSVFVNLFMDSSQTGGEFFIRGIWDFSSHPNSGRWSTNEKVDYTPFNFNNKVKRVKIRGSGKALQFMVESTTSKPFNLIGWGIVESANRWV